MKKLIWALPLALFAFMLASCSEVTPVSEDGISAAASKMGDIAPDTDFKLNIIGVKKDKTADMDDNNGRRIFVQLYGGQKVCVTNEDWDLYQELQGIPEADWIDNPYECTEEEWAEDPLLGGRGKVTGGWDELDKVNKILLTPNETGEFGVLDANATDQDGAEFTMPDNVATQYKVYARALGKPGGKAAITLCANETEETADLNGIETWCSINQAVLERTKGKPSAEDVTDELFTLTILIDADAEKDLALSYCLAQDQKLGFDDEATTDQIVDVPIFHTCFEDYFWNYDNNGLKLLQLWFVQTDMNGEAV